jgi:hypothetical protein
MKILLTLFALLVSTVVLSQSYTRITQTTIVQQNNHYSSNNFGLSMIAIEISAFRNSWDNRRKREEAVSKAQAQLALVKQAYETATSYPETIIDGWHLVMATDNYNYCSPAKVFIKDNQIVEFVVGNWEKLSRPFEVLSPIEKGKAMIILDFGSKSDLLELYFINDLTQPTLVEKPLSSGYISFWSDLKRADKVKIWFEGTYYGELGGKMEETPNCSNEKTITIEVKPGVYSFKGAGRGRIAWEGRVEAKENMCFSYLLNESNRR